MILAYLLNYFNKFYNFYLKFCILKFKLISNFFHQILLQIILHYFLLKLYLVKVIITPTVQKLIRRK